MSDKNDDTDRLAAIEARMTALSALMKSVISTFMIHGLLTRAEIAPLIEQAEALMRPMTSPAAAVAELAAVEKELPQYMRANLGPPPDPDEHDH
jgi:hypothetical protein